MKTVYSISCQYMNLTVVFTTKSIIDLSKIAVIASELTQGNARVLSTNRPLQCEARLLANFVQSGARIKPETNKTSFEFIIKGLSVMWLV